MNMRAAARAVPESVEQGVIAPTRVAVAMEVVQTMHHSIMFPPGREDNFREQQEPDGKAVSAATGAFRAACEVLRNYLTGENDYANDVTSPAPESSDDDGGDAEVPAKEPVTTS